MCMRAIAAPKGETMKKPMVTRWGKARDIIAAVIEAMYREHGPVRANEEGNPVNDIQCKLHEAGFKMPSDPHTGSFNAAMVLYIFGWRAK